MKQLPHKLFCLFFLAQLACSKEEVTPVPTSPESPDEPEVYTLPVVVHVLHSGEEVGQGPNMSMERIERQIEILNEDFRRMEGTRGFNDHPEGGDARIEFILAKQDPEGNPTNGIVRKQMSFNEIPDDVPGIEVEWMGYFSYWDSKDYINIWSAPYDEGVANAHLGSATGPDSDLPGDELFLKPLPGGKEGIVINWWHFGESDVAGVHNLGRTLTHEMGHYLGLLHTWGSRDCETNDYCDDTPAVDEVVNGSTPYDGCSGEEVQLSNYMNYTPDAIMNLFTNDQIERMRYIVENSPRRTSLMTSPGLISK